MISRCYAHFYILLQSYEKGFLYEKQQNPLQIMFDVYMSMCQCVCSLHPFHPLPNTVMPKEKRFKPKVSCIELEENHHAANSQDSLLHQASIGTQLMCRTVGSTLVSTALGLSLFHEQVPVQGGRVRTVSPFRLH